MHDTTAQDFATKRLTIHSIQFSRWLWHQSTAVINVLSPRNSDYPAAHAHRRHFPARLCHRHRQTSSLTPALARRLHKQYQHNNGALFTLLIENN